MPAATVTELNRPLEIKFKIVKENGQQPCNSASLMAKFRGISSSGIICSRLLKTQVIRHRDDGHSGVRKLNTRVVGGKPGEWFTGYRAHPSYP